MLTTEDTLDRLTEVPGLTLHPGALLREYTRFGLGGPADLLVEAADPPSFIAALEAVRASGRPFLVIGGGTNLVVDDRGFPGVVLRLMDRAVTVDGLRITAGAGAELQSVVDASVEHGLAGMEVMTGIPGSIGAAVYGNAGAYGRSMSDNVSAIEFYDGSQLRTTDNAGCEFRYRESIFKQRKDWLISRVEVTLTPGDPSALRAKADEILTMRNHKYPPTMRCAGSIFKNLLLAELPPAAQARVPETVVKKGKVPAAYFLDVVGAKGLRRGDIQVAPYHANLIYNDGVGTTADLKAVIQELQDRVAAEFGFRLEEEVQYV